jgi:hypothetical protein
MKATIIPLAITLLVGCYGRQPSIKTGKEGKPLPSLTLLLMDSISHMSTNKIPDEKPVIVFLFSPRCPYCRAQTEEIIENIKSLTDLQFYFLSAFPFSFVKSYFTHYQLGKYPNIIVGQDDKMDFSNYYQAQGVPYIAVYGKDKLLKQAFMGKVSINVLKNIALE